MSTTQVATQIEVRRLETVSLSASSNVDELTGAEFFKLVGKLYEKLGYSNRVTVRIKGLAKGLENKLEFDPSPWGLDDEEWVDND